MPFVSQGDQKTRKLLFSTVNIVALIPCSVFHFVRHQLKFYYFISGLRSFVGDPLVPSHTRAKNPATTRPPSPSCSSRSWSSKICRGGKKIILRREPSRITSLLMWRVVQRRSKERDVCAVRGARGPGARRAPGAGLPSPPGDLCVLAPSAPAAGARRRAHTRRGAIVPSFSGSRRAANRRLGREGCRPGRRVLPRQGARPRLFLASWDMVAAPWPLSHRAIESLGAEPLVICRCPSVWLGWVLGSRSCREFWIFPQSCPSNKIFRMPCYGGLVCLHFRYGFGSYFNLLPGSEWSALLLTYGFPLTIIGMALKARTFPIYVHVQYITG
jgi:hypothetical protein